MNKTTKSGQMILYRYEQEDLLLKKMEHVMFCHPVDSAPNAEHREVDMMQELYCSCIHELIDLAGDFGFYGNLWHDYLTYLLVNHENAYSKACEIRGDVKGSIQQLVKHDFELFRQLYQYDLFKLEEMLHMDFFPIIADYKNVNGSGKMYNCRIRDRICDLSKKLGRSENVEEFQKHMTEFYKDFGVGKFGLHKAFRISHTASVTEIVPIRNTAHVQLDDLVGYEIAKKKLIDNTEAFVRGRKANNCLLFGDAGTGKSSSIKGILNRYYDKGLRIIEVYKHQFQYLNDVIAQVKNRNYRFIIYMDDLSFEEFEIEYKYLKAVIEGGLEKKPENILIYATSNRRHLIQEKYSDKEGRRDSMHSSDTVQEKLSLVSRFGVQIFFCAPNKKEFQNIVQTLAQKHEIHIPEEQLLLEANKWELTHGGLSGRCAQQFIDYLLGTVCDERGEDDAV